MSIFHETLKRYWGYDEFRPLQEEIIASVSEGKDTLGLMPTGGGKSITFQVPALTMEGICIVVTPLIALMKDQVDNLKKLGIKAAAVHSGMTRQEIIVTLENCIFGGYKFLYVSPERIHTELFQTKLRYLQVSLLVIDESHCISQWGYDFRPSYLRIAEIRDSLPEVPVLALTATATAEVIDDIQEKLHFRAKNVFRKSFERKNLAYVVRQTDDKVSEAANILEKVPGTAIIYVRSRRKTKELATELSAQGIQADYYHAGLSPEEKTLKQNAWKSGKCRVIVCTSAFGMGIDKPDVRVVIHHEMPSSPEEYYQEAGRAGRDEKRAYAIALYSNADKVQLKKRVTDNFPDPDFIKDVYEKLAYFFQLAVGYGFQSTYDFSLEKFCHTFKYNITHTHSALKILELSGYIEYMDEVENRSRLMFLVKRDELYSLSSFSGEVEELIRSVLRLYEGLFSTYVYINENDLAVRTGMTRQGVYEALKMLGTLRIVHYIPARETPFITYTQRREELKHVQIPRSVYEERKKRLKERVDSILFYASTESHCRSRLLLTYFGEKNAKDCGQCDVCLRRKRKGLNTSVFEEISRTVFDELGESPLTVKEIVKRLSFPEEQVVEVVEYLLGEDRLVLEGNVLMLPKGRG